jgi:hypothetical protein
MDSEQQPLSVSSEADPRPSHNQSLHTSKETITEWSNNAHLRGMNVVFRPQKSISIISKPPKRTALPGQDDDRHAYLLLIYSMVFVTIGSYLPAFLLSDFTFLTVGFGCRC